MHDKFVNPATKRFKPTYQNTNVKSRLKHHQNISKVKIEDQFYS